MTPANQDRLKGLLGVMVRRHTRKDHPSHPVGLLIAEEARQLRGERALCEHALSASGPGAGPAGKDADQLLVDRLYRRFLLPRQTTVEALAECDTVTCDDR